MSFDRFTNNDFKHRIGLRLSDQELNKKPREKHIKQKTDEKKITKFD